jgi:hypothetical protein
LPRRLGRLRPVDPPGGRLLADSHPARGGQAEAHPRAALTVAGEPLDDPDAAAVSLDDGARDGQAEAAASVVARSPIGALLEGLEDPRAAGRSSPDDRRSPGCGRLRLRSRRAYGADLAEVRHMARAHWVYF